MAKRSGSSERRNYRAKSQVRQAQRRNASVTALSRQGPGRQGLAKSRRGITQQNLELPFSPPEDWHEPTEAGNGYRVVTQAPGEGYSHVVTPSEIRGKLAELPEQFLRDLEVVQLSRMTRKKQSLPCYGMQWGPTLYLYPIDETLIEHFYAPPGPNVVNETKMYGGQWSEPEPGVWALTWSETAIRDFYLNNILVHELGHLLDERNSSYTDRERFAEWFATEFGYRRTGGAASRRPKQRVSRRHHTA